LTPKQNHRILLAKKGRIKRVTSPTIRCGVAGWNYPQWDRFVYPQPSRAGFHPLEFLAGRLDTIEIPNIKTAIRPELSRLWATKVAHNGRFQFTARVPLEFTAGRNLDSEKVKAWVDGVKPLLEAGRLGCAVLEFPEAFRFTRENREHLIRVRRALHPLPLVAELHHESWTSCEGRGTLIDYHVGFCNLDQPESVVATPPTAFLTWKVGYVKLYGKTGDSHLYTPGELAAWKQRIARFSGFSESTFVVFGNSNRGKSVVNALQMQSLLIGLEQQAPVVLRPPTQPSHGHGSRRAA
jgi:uncharacterized protein YecE (DUF72 family)